MSNLALSFGSDLDGLTIPKALWMWCISSSIPRTESFKGITPSSKCGLVVGGELLE